MRKTFTCFEKVIRQSCNLATAYGEPRVKPIRRYVIVLWGILHVGKQYRLNLM